MSSFNQSRTSPAWEPPKGPQVVSMPTPNEGVRRALLGSFGAFPPMPEEFARLLDRLR